MHPKYDHRAASIFVFFFIFFSAFLIRASEPEFAAIESIHGVSESQFTVSDNPNVDPQGDDLIPWPWGSECSFPWDDINGRYRVTRPKGGTYNGHSIDFRLRLEVGGESNLDIRQFNNRGREIAKGKGRTLNDTRFVRGLMEDTRTGHRYTVIVRTYSKDKKTKCGNTETALVVSFCSLRGRKCLETDSYELIRRPPRNVRP